MSKMYDQRTALITGVAGFIGFHASLKLWVYAAMYFLRIRQVIVAITLLQALKRQNFSKLK